MKAHRMARVAERIREIASETILFEMQDPRIKGVTVIRAEVSGDLQHAKVFVSVMGTPGEQRLCMHGLKHSTGYLQSKLAKQMTTRFTPIVEFVLDEGVKRSIEITRLLNEEKQRGGAASPDDEESVVHQEDSADGTAEEAPVDSSDQS